MSDKSGVGSDVISLPKGGGALSGIGETFAPDLHTGTGNFTVPLVVPAGRGDLQPQLSLAYSTGNGNGPFGLGWQLNLPGVSRKTSQGVPRYDDATDTFVLSGAEDLVPIRREEDVTQYRPRTEGLFARILHHRDPGNDFWEVWTKDGLRSLYGTPGAAGADAAVVRDPADPRRVFTWKLHQTVDPFGNRIAYEYQRDTGEAAGQSGWDQLYLSAVRYVDYTDEDGDERFLISVTLDHDPPDSRPDAFSDFRAGFEVRTRRRCRRIAIATDADIHRRVRTYEFVYLDDRVAAGELADSALPLNRVSLLNQVRLVGHDDERADDDSEQMMPPLEFGYSTFDPQRRDLVALQGDDLPARSLASDDLELADLFGNGLPDIIEMNGIVRYWRNLGGGRFDRPRSMSTAPSGVRLADPGVQLIDADGDGRIDLLATIDGLAGYFPLNFDGSWDRGSFRRYAQAPSFALEGPNVRLLDLDGDGVTDALRAGTRFEHYFNDSETGWSPPRVVERRRAEVFPDVDLADSRVHLADLTGDGLQDIVLVHDGNVEYWPNLGHGDWGHRRHMRDGPRLPFGYDPKRILIGDVDGDGLADFVYVDDGRVVVWINQSGNQWSPAVQIPGTPRVTDMDAVRLVDLLGTGVAGVLWSADAGAPGRDHLWFLDFTAGNKPYLLYEMRNNMGAVTQVEYAPSTRFYLDDQHDPGTRWRTQLPFPVQVVARVQVIDVLSRGKLSTEYSYHHGCWDGAEHDFRGFARVDQFDTETFDQYHKLPTDGRVGEFSAVSEEYFSPPTLTKTWFHPGIWGRDHGKERPEALTTDSWERDPSLLVEQPGLTAILGDPLLTHQAKRDAIRALRGKALRSELYALDGTARQKLSYTVTESVYDVQEIDVPAKRAGQATRIFFPHVVAERTTQWERGDDPLTSFAFAGDYDLASGDPRQLISLAVARGRDFRVASGPAEPYLGTVSTTRLAHRDDAQQYLIGRVVSTTVREIINDGSMSVLELLEHVRGREADLPTVAQQLHYYDGEAFVGLPLGELGEFGVLVRTERLVLTEDILRVAYQDEEASAVAPTEPPYMRVDGAHDWTDEYPHAFRELPALAGYTFHPGDPRRERGYFTHELRRSFDFHGDAAVPRGLLTVTRDELGRDTSVSYDRFLLLPVLVTGARGLTERAVYDYRVLQPALALDVNGNRTVFTFNPLGLLECVAAMGKETEPAGDTLDTPGLRMTYNFLAFFTGPADERQPLSVRTVVREHHVNDFEVPLPLREATISTIEYSDGLGRLLQTRTQAEAVLFGDSVFGDGTISGDQSDPAANTTARRREGDDSVIVSGWQRYDNKGQVVEAYEPYYDTGYAYCSFEEAVRRRDAGDSNFFGRRVSHSYDALGNRVSTVNADGSQERVVRGTPRSLADPEDVSPTPWELYFYDANDNAGRTHPESSQSYRLHWDTPGSSMVDALGRTTLTVERDGVDPSSWRRTRASYDLRGNLTRLIDSLGRVTVQCTYDLADNALRVEGIDSGVRRAVLNARGLPLERRDGREALVLSSYDDRDRLVRLWARDRAGEVVSLRQRLVYGDDNEEVDRDEARHRNALGQLVVQYDEAGRLEVLAYDLGGRVVEKKRQVFQIDRVLSGFAAPSPDWNVRPFRVDWQPSAGATLAAHAASLLSSDEYSVTTEFDALGRPKRITYPADADGFRRVLIPEHDRAGSLRSVAINGQIIVDHIARNALGQRTLIAYGNGVMTRYAYDAHSARLRRIRSERYSRQESFAYAPVGAVLQDAGYLQDLVGNVTLLRERAPSSGIPTAPLGGDALDRRFTYSPTYRLLSATGRDCDVAGSMPPWEHRPGCRDITRARPYAQRYDYDSAGNVERARHSTPDGGMTTAYTRGAADNRLATVTIGATIVPYGYDASGNLVSEGASRHFEFDYANALRVYRTQTDGAEPSIYGQYLCDTAGQRVMKVTRHQGGSVDITVSIDALFEHHVRIRAGSSQSNTDLHILDDTRRIASLRIGQPFSDDHTPSVHYHLTDHLDSTVLTVDANGDLVHRYEYSPYGESSFGTFSRRRYRFGGKARDEESGLVNFGSRHYAPWLASWCSTEPSAEHSTYAFARDNPLRYADPDGASPVDKLAEKAARGAKAVAAAFLREHGERVARGLIRGVRTRALGFLNRGGQRLDAALEHVALHFVPAPHKQVHTIFLEKFRSRGPVTDLIRRTIAKPSRAPALTRLTGEGGAVGDWAFIIEREFAEAIGTEVSERGAEIVAKKTNVLRVILDRSGHLVTAYPITPDKATETVRWAAFRIAVKAAAGASAAGIVYVAGEAEAYAEVLSSERAAHQEDLRRHEEQVESSWWEWLLPIGTESARMGYEPGVDVGARGAAAVLSVEERLGITLSPEESRQVQSDVRNIWLGRE